MIGDNAGRLLHDRHPIRIGHPGHENGAVAKEVDPVCILDHADFGGSDSLADSQAAQQPFALLLQGVGM